MLREYRATQSNYARSQEEIAQLNAQVMRQNLDRDGLVRGHQQREAAFNLAEQTFSIAAAHATSTNEVLRQEVQTAGAAGSIYLGELRQENSAYSSMQLEESSRINIVEQQARQNALDEQTTQRTIQQLRESDTRSRDDSS